MELIVLRNGEEVRVTLDRSGQASVVRIGDNIYEVNSVSTVGSVRSLIVAGRQYEVSIKRSDANRYQVSHRGAVEEVEVLDPLAYLASEGLGRGKLEGPQTISAYMPGRVVKVLVAEGDEVEAGEGLVVLEAMKMENEIQADHAGVVRRVLVTDGQPVEGGDPLFEME
ncbi:MAG: biotin/lipoyl-binding protein [Acidobacteriota bacterium]